VDTPRLSVPDAGVGEPGSAPLRATAPRARGADGSIDPDRLRGERDLYRQLTLLGEHVDLERFLADALASIVEIGGAARGLLEVYDEHEATGGRRWRASHGLLEDEIESVRVAVSRGMDVGVTFKPRCRNIQPNSAIPASARGMPINRSRNGSAKAAKSTQRG
jgi:hypothetical protein